MISQQLVQIFSFLDVYDIDVVKDAVIVYFSGDQDSVFAGRSSEIPLAQSVGALTATAKSFVMEESQEQQSLLPFCLCGAQFTLVGVCPSCEKGIEGFRSKYTCVRCLSEEYSLLTVPEQLDSLRRLANDAAASTNAQGGS